MTYATFALSFDLLVMLHVSHTHRVLANAVVSVQVEVQVRRPRVLVLNKDCTGTSTQILAY
jgi:hypothetical protein